MFQILYIINLYSDQNYFLIMEKV